MTDHDDTHRSPATVSTNLHLPAGAASEVHDYGTFGVLRVGDRDAEISLFGRAGAARDVAERATVWADLAEARERGEDVTLWGSWVLPSDTFRGPR
jgi:hypothetical protein